MASLPFPLWRPLLLFQGTLLDRREPDLAYLRSIGDPDRFGWAILPHVARSFAASIVLLPQAPARAARVGYLYARMLDTYEDMVPDPTQRIEGLQWFATRFSTGQLAVAAPKVEMAATNPREEVHKLLVEQCELVDRLYTRLPESDRAKVAVLITEMAASMQRWGATFASQGGTLETDEQLARYCDDVIGEPARFAVALMVRGPLSESQDRRVSTVSELVQLANVTRDIERDLEHGVGYHPALKPYLGEPATDRQTQEQVRGVREELLVRALRCVPAYTELLEDLPLPMFSAVRGSGVLMLLFTDRYYRACAVRVGHEPWRGSNSTVRLLGSSVLSVLSRRWARRTARRVETRFLAAADSIGGSGA